MKLDTLVSGYISLRDAIEADETEFKAKVKPKKEMLEKIEQEFKKHFDATGTDNLTVKGVGTAFKKIVTSVTVGDWDEVWEYIQKNEAWDVLEHRANKTAVLARLKEEGELLPGINMTQVVDVQVRRA